MAVSIRSTMIGFATVALFFPIPDIGFVGVSEGPWDAGRPPARVQRSTRRSRRSGEESICSKFFQAFPEYDLPLPTAPTRRMESHSKELTKGRDSKPKPRLESMALPTEVSEEAEADWSSWDSAEWRDNFSSDKPQPPGRRLHEWHVRRLNEFRTRMEERPQLLEKTVKRRRSRSP